MGITKIEWTSTVHQDGTVTPGYTFNPWIGCQKVSPGCDNCYAEAMMDKRWGKVQWGPHGERKRTSEANWKQPYKWARNARLYNATLLGREVRPRVFCASLADVFDNKAPQAWRTELFNMIQDTPELDWLLLTKRPQNIRKMLPRTWGNGWPNVWLGTTCEDQEHYNHRWPILCEIPAKVRFISYEPAIGPLIDLWAGTAQIPDWIICGGESGHGARLMETAWARKVRDLCAQKPPIAFFMKQMTGKGPIPDDLMVRQFPEGGLKISAGSV